MKPEISLITPCYKMEKYLNLFLKKLPEQTIFNKIELILDHSEPTKKEIKLVKDFQKKYPNRLKHVVNKKVISIGNAMNNCIKYSKGTYLAIWNVDDLRTNNSLELQYNILKKKKFLGFVFGNYKIVKNFGSENGTIVKHDKNSLTELKSSMKLGPFFMFKKKLIKKVGFFDEQLLSSADFDFAIRLAYLSKGTVVNKILGYYLNEGKGLSTRPSSLQAVESNFIHFRYGVFNKVLTANYYLPTLIRYDHRNYHFFNKRYPVESYFKNYNEMISKKINKYFEDNKSKKLILKILQKLKLY
jgi:glycosyltransferase involved in cell wall biosynthesis